MIRAAAAASLLAAGAWAAVGGAAPPARAQGAAAGLCARLALPEGIDLACREEPGAEGGAAVAIVEPLEGEFAALSRLTARELVRTGQDRLAWDDPAAWLEARVTVDPTGLADALGGLATSPDSPLAGDRAREGAAAIEGLLGRLGQLPLAACEDPAPAREGRVWELRCRYSAAGVGLLRVERVVAPSGDRRFAVAYRAANERRLRHFEALANNLDR